MKNFTKTLIVLFSIVCASSCYYDDGYYDDRPTDFNGDISETEQFYFSTPTTLTLLEKTAINDTISYQVGDTIKLELNLNSIFEEEVGSNYDLYKSSNQSDSFDYSISNYYYDGVEFESKVIDLNILENNPEVINLTTEEILSSAQYKNLFLDIYNIPAFYDNKTQNYHSKIGIIIKSHTENTTLNETEINNDFRINYSSYISNQKDYYDNNTLELNIPIISEIDNYTFIIE